MNDFFGDSFQSAFRWQSQVPWLFLALMSLPLVFSASRLKIFPSAGWVILLAVSLVACVITIFVPNFLVITVAIDGLLVLLSLADWLWVWFPSRRGILVQREVSSVMSLGVPTDSDLTVENRTGMTLVGEVRDDLPDTFTSNPPQHPLRLLPSSRMTARCELTAGKRGSFELERVYLKFRSPTRLWVCHKQMPLVQRLKVYPDMKQLSDYALLARTNRLSLIGVRKTRRIGQDSDFERLRDYSRDDNYRHIDWRSTARRRKLTVRQFQTDQSQRVIFLLDCGRMMTNSRDGYSLLDHALNSMLMMAYVALQQGDSVGLICFSDTIHSYIPPRGGGSQMNRLLQAGFDQFPRMVESRYDQAFLYLSTHCKRRSLVVLATNVIDEVNASVVVDYLSNISGHHLPLGVLLRDRQMFDAADFPAGPSQYAATGPVGQTGSATGHVQSQERDAATPARVDPFLLYRAAAAADILLWRDQVIRDLQHRGVLTIDAFPDELTAPLVNQYLDVKAKHLL